jgi:hypothetical protein
MAIAKMLQERPTSVNVSLRILECWREHWRKHAAPNPQILSRGVEHQKNALADFSASAEGA